MKSWNEMLEFMPAKVRDIFAKLDQRLATTVEEVRLRAERPLALSSKGKTFYLDVNSSITGHHSAVSLMASDLLECVRLLSNSSLYAWDEELRQGYVTVKGGHRVGLAGRVLVDKGQVRGMKDISSLNFRIAREISGCSDRLAQAVLAGKPLDTLLISPPRGGKTTLLRDLIRQTSLHGHTVCVIDERSEIAACWQGIPQKNLGPNTDVLDACPKAEGMMLAIRSLGPTVVAVDEIGREEDAEALLEAARAGVTVFATAHAADLKEALSRPILNKIISGGMFKKIVVLDPYRREEYVISDFPRELKAC